MSREGSWQGPLPAARVRGAKPIGRDEQSESSAWNAPIASEAEAIDPAELRDFLAGDLVAEQADPGFKERLRSTLWELVKARAAKRKPPRED